MYQSSKVQVADEKIFLQESVSHRNFEYQKNESLSRSFYRRLEQNVRNKILSPHLVFRFATIKFNGDQTDSLIYNQ